MQSKMEASKVHVKMQIYFITSAIILVKAQDFTRTVPKQETPTIDVVDLTFPTNMKDLLDYFNIVEKSWKICTNCGHTGLGTAMHMEHTAANSPVFPAIIPAEYLVTRLVVIDVSALAKLNPRLVLTLDVALQWKGLKHDPEEPTLILFNFGYKSEEGQKTLNTCDCHFPGISIELASYIAENLTRVVGVATDAPSLESEQSRELALSKSVSNVLGKVGIYMIENVNVRRTLPEYGCLSIVMPLKLLNANFVPTRLTAFCPTKNKNQQIVLASRNTQDMPKILDSRIIDIDLNELLN